MEDDAIAIGRVLRAHGLKGECLTELFGESLYAVKLPWEIRLARDSGEILESRILGFREVARGRVLLRLEGIDSREAAQQWRGAEISVNESALPGLASNEVREYELINARLEDSGGGLLGVITKVFPTGKETVLGIETETNKEVLLPFVKELISGFKREAGQLVVTLKSSVDWERFLGQEE